MPTLPNLLIAGVAKAATTSLFDYLSQHPDICPSSVKEPNHFSIHRPGGSAISLEDYADLVAHCGDARFRMEATPSYWWGGAPVIQAIQDTLERPRIIISLRDPVAMLWSNFTFHKSVGRADKDEPLDVRLKIWEQEHLDWQAGEREQPPTLSLGFYGDYLEPWLDAFGDDLRIVFAEDLAADPAAVVSGLFNWLGLAPEPSDVIDYTQRNPTAAPRSQRIARAAHRVRRHTNWLLRRQQGVRALLRRLYRAVNTQERQERLSADQRAYLESRYEKSNRALGDLLRRRGYEGLPAWLSGYPARR